MTPQQIEDRAKAYVDRVLRSQERNGSKPNLSPEEYSAAIQKAAEGVSGLSRS